MITRLALALALTPLCLAGCASSPIRLEPSSYGCMSAVVQQKVPPTLPDKQTHCLASGLIARYCSRPEAYLAGIGKEWRDMFTGGDVEWSDWQADRSGIRCAKQARDDASIVSCCASIAPAK